MKLLRVITVFMWLLLGLSGATSAQSVDKTPDLTASANTVGGPGAFKGGPGDTGNLFHGFSPITLDLCVTVVNVGSGTVALVFDLGNASIGVAAGTTRAVCRNGNEAIDFTCSNSPGTSCKFLWRVDRL